jgi:hypothetical protein
MGIAQQQQQQPSLLFPSMGIALTLPKNIYITRKRKYL